MSGGFASGKYAFGFCDRCGRRQDLAGLRKETEESSIRVCDECFEQEHPQLDFSKIQTGDSQSIRNARPDQSLYALGNEGAGGSRMTQWGWNPVGGSQESDLTPNDLVCDHEVGTVTVVVA